MYKLVKFQSKYREDGTGVYAFSYDDVGGEIVRLNDQGEDLWEVTWDILSGEKGIFRTYRFPFIQFASGNTLINHIFNAVEESRKENVS